MKKCVIFGAVSCNLLPPSINEGDLVIAADAGYLNCKALGIVPHIVVGDFDSLEQIPEGVKIIRHPVKKDDTDTMLALKIGISQGYTNFRLYGCAGGRLDHTFANLQLLSYAANRSVNAVMLDTDCAITVIKNNKITFSKDNEGNISVFAFNGTVNGVYEKNLLYQLENAEISPDFPIGVSNEFTGKEASVKVNDGELLIIWNNKFGNYFIGDLNDW